MWNDNETDEDLIDYGHLVEAVSNIIDAKNLLPCSIGVFGDWGSGKSSLMRMIEQKYEGESDILVIKFNGWLFEGYEDAKLVLMSKIVDTIIAERKLSDRAIIFASKLLKNIDIIKTGGALLKYGLGFAAAGPAGLAAVSMMDVVKKAAETDYSKLLKEDKSKIREHDVKNNIQDFHENFSKLLDETNLEKVLIFIDDLDRCSPATVIGTLEAIKLFLFTKKTAFIIGADERLIKHAVKARFPEISGENAEVGRDYLEKLIQFPVRIPPLNSRELTNYSNLLFAQLHSDVGEFGINRGMILEEKRKKGFDFIFDSTTAHDFFSVGDELGESLVMCGQIMPMLSTGLNGNPRQCKRFLNTLLLRIKMAESVQIELKKSILAKLMLLEYFKPETFKKFYELQASNFGKVELLKVLEGDEEGASTEYELYHNDKWLSSWIKLSPPIANEDLSAYFHFSRDQLSVVSFSAQRLSPEAGKILKSLSSDAKAERLLTISKLAELAPADASAVFAVLVERFKQEEDHDGEFSTLDLMFSFADKRGELKTELISLLERFPEKQLPVKVASLVSRTFKETEFIQTAEALLKKWELNSTNTNLAKMAKTAKNNLKK